ncbi:hypothetical protein [Lignipirellula cremea]|uniref:Uncharacterized protein n=1 Tax=Lignipirellula cremea TaxID=2528010 RepID=A0A518E2F6_9BACT|nr:hypothetical protein [Lignipirellula cremea]QDU98277.1 hypothetical protein Pla8534_61390 [Lignipirellula cremea]
MHDQQTPPPFPQVWIGTDLGDYRTCTGTYQGYDLSTVPPLPEDRFDGSFAWLLSQPSPFTFDKRFGEFWTNYDSLEKRKTDAPQSKAALLQESSRLGVEIPAAFFLFLDNLELVTRIRSCTDCYFEYAQTLLPHPEPPGGHFVHFYSDSQYCCLWYLYIDPQQRCYVVASDDLTEPVDENSDQETWRKHYGGPALLCAWSFESFVYRLWIENEIWYRLNLKDQPPLLEEMRDYLAFYASDA